MKQFLTKDFLNMPLKGYLLNKKDKTIKLNGI